MYSLFKQINEINGIDPRWPGWIVSPADKALTAGRALKAVSIT